MFDININNYIYKITHDKLYEISHLILIDKLVSCVVNMISNKYKYTLYLFIKLFESRHVFVCFETRLCFIFYKNRAEFPLFL